MAEIYTRFVPEETKRALAVQAASYGMSLNSFCIMLFDEAAMPYGELVDAIRERAEELAMRNDRRLVLKHDDVPAPDSNTRPFPKQRRGWRP